MLTEIAEKISLRLIANKIISIDNRKYYTYGIELVLSDIFICLSIAIIAILTDNLIASLTYAVTYCVLRAYVGGYHCKTYARCYGTTLSFYAVMLILNYYLKCGKLVVSCALAVIAFAVILIFAPIEYGYDPLNKIKKRKYRIKVYLFSILDVIAFLLSWIFNRLDISFAISWGVFVVFVLMLPSLVSNLLKVRKKT